MVVGIDSFREKFKDYTDCYTIIGGTACDILMTYEDLDFRATKDIDMILLFEDRYPEFARVFWSYIKEGSYKYGWKNSDSVHFYRFTEPKNGYPKMIELFSRKPDYHLDVEEGIVPIHIDDNISSLSAILLNDEYYNFMLSGRKVIDDVCVLSEEYLIPFKMYAWNDLTRKKSNGEHVNERDLKKHKYDVFRLLQIVEVGSTVSSTGIVQDNIKSFLNAMESEELPLSQIGLPFNRTEALQLLKDIYLIHD